MTEWERKAAEYRQKAALCLDVAERMSLKVDRDRMMEMAKRLLDLAREAQSKADRDLQAPQ